MCCDRFDQELNEVALGAVPSTELAHHLGSCPICREEIAERRRLWARIDAELTLAAQTEPSPDLRARIREAVATASQGSRRRSLIWSLTWAVSLALIVVVAGLSVRSSGRHAWRWQTPEQTPEPEKPKPLAEATPISPPSSLSVPKSPAVIRRSSPGSGGLDSHPSPSRGVGVSPASNETVVVLAAFVRQAFSEQSAIAGLQQEPALLTLEAISISPISFEPLDNGSEADRRSRS